MSFPNSGEESDGNCPRPSFGPGARVLLLSRGVPPPAVGLRRAGGMLWAPCWCWVVPPGCSCLSPLEAGADRGLKRSASWADHFAYLFHSESWRESGSVFCPGYWFTLTTCWPCLLLQIGYFFAVFFHVFAPILLSRGTTQDYMKLADTYWKKPVICDYFLGSETVCGVLACLFAFYRWTVCLWVVL